MSGFFSGKRDNKFRVMVSGLSGLLIGQKLYNQAIWGAVIGASIGMVTFPPEELETFHDIFGRGLGGALYDLVFLDDVEDATDMADINNETVNVPDVPEPDTLADDARGLGDHMAQEDATS